MRTGDLKRAHKRFVKAVALEPNFNDAHSNLKDLEDYFRQTNLHIDMINESDKTNSIQMHDIHYPIEVSPDKLWSEVLSNEHGVHESLEGPFISRGAWDLISVIDKTSISTYELLETLIKQFGEKIVDFYPHGKTYY